MLFPRSRSLQKLISTKYDNFYCLFIISLYDCECYKSCTEHVDVMKCNLYTEHFVIVANSVKEYMHLVFSLKYRCFVGHCFLQESAVWTCNNCGLIQKKKEERKKA